MAQTGKKWIKSLHLEILLKLVQILTLGVAIDVKTNELSDRISLNPRLESLPSQDGLHLSSIVVPGELIVKHHWTKDSKSWENKVEYLF